MISYAQNFEDVMLWRALGHIKSGCYIDVGANDPDLDSVTKAFYDQGWRGINVEPVPYWFERIQQSRPRDINLNVAVSSKKGRLRLYEVVDSGLSTIVPEFATDAMARGFESKQITVDALRLTAICEQYVNGEIHFMKIDVEGAEKNVLRGMKKKKFRPWILVIEANLPNPVEENYKDWEDLVTEANYRFVYADGLNRFYISTEHFDALASVFRYPPNVFDMFSVAPVLL